MQSIYEAKQLKKQLIAAALLALIILILIHHYSNKRIKSLSAKVAKLTNEMNTKPKVDDLTQQKSQSLKVTEILKSVAEYQSYTQHLISAVLNNLPTGICLDGFSRQKGKIGIQGQIDDDLVLLTYLKQPQAHLQDIQLKQIKQNERLTFLINANQTKVLPDLKIVDTAEMTKENQEDNASLL